MGRQELTWMDRWPSRIMCINHNLETQETMENVFFPLIGKHFCRLEPLQGQNKNRNTEMILRDSRHKVRTQPSLGRGNNKYVDFVMNHYYWWSMTNQKREVSSVSSIAWNRDSSIDSSFMFSYGPLAIGRTESGVHDKLPRV